MIKRNDAKAGQAKSCPKNAAKLWSTYSLMVACSLLLIGGFFFAGQQHFSSMDYGIKNSRLRKQVDELESEKRRLMHAREVSLSPSEIKKAAKKSGMTGPLSTEMDVALASLASVKKNPNSLTPDSTTKSMVIKTAAVTSVASAVTASYKKPEKSAKDIRKTTPTE